MDRLVRQRARDAPVDDVDDAADRRRAVEQRLGPAQHLDPLGQQRIDHHRMVDAGVRDVDRADPIGQHAHALALEAAQHRARRVRPERRRRHAGGARQGLADRRAQRLSELRALEYRHARQDVAAVARERRGDDDVGGRQRVIAAAAVLGGRRRGLRPGRRRSQDQCTACEQDRTPHLETPFSRHVITPFAIAQIALKRRSSATVPMTQHIISLISRIGSRRPAPALIDKPRGT